LNIKFPNTIFENKKRNADQYSEIALEIRRDIIKSLYLAGSGHSGGSLGCADLLAVLFFGGNMRYNPHDAAWNERDRFILSAGHLCPVLYSALARAGFFPAEELASLRKYGSRLQGHPALEYALPGIECSTGSLGQGVSIAVGMAINDKLVDKSDRKVFVLTGDGELQEGSVWEAAMAAGNYRLNNLCWLVDNNDCQIDGRVKDVMSIYPLEDKFRSFNFEVVTIDGHDYEQIQRALDKFFENSRKTDSKPFVIIAHTRMGKGVSFMDDRFEWHGIPPNLEQAEAALNELSTK